MKKFIQFWIGLTIFSLIIYIPVYLVSNSAENIAEKFSLLDFYNTEYRTTSDSNYGIKKRKEYFDEVKDNIKRMEGIDISDPIFKIVKKSEHIKYISFKFLKKIGNAEVYEIEYKFKNANSDQSEYIYIVATEKNFWDVETAKFMHIGIINEGREIPNVDSIGAYLKTKIYKIKSYYWNRCLLGSGRIKSKNDNGYDANGGE